MLNFQNFVCKHSVEEKKDMMTNWVHFENFEEMKNFVDTISTVGLENFRNLVGKNHIVGFEDLAYCLNYGGFGKRIDLGLDPFGKRKI